MIKIFKTKTGIFFNLVFRLTPTRLIVLSFIIIIMTGAVLLSLPMATRNGQGVAFIDGIFTATSATCITGLVVFDTYSKWSVFGQIVILVLVQLGGLGLMTWAALISFALRRKFSYKERLLMANSISSDSLSGIARITRNVLIGTITIETICALLLAVRFIPEFGIKSGIAKSIFISVSAFCNAGFDIMGVKGEFTSLTSYVSDLTVNFTVMGAVIIGGIGFYVWEDIIHFKGFRKLSLHTKIILSTTVFLILGGAILFYYFEKNNVMKDLGFGSKILASIFQSVTTRTAGFNTIDQGLLTGSSKFLSIMLMFIGGSPGSTAGGIKTATFAIVMITVFARIIGSRDINVFYRRIDEKVAFRAMTILIISMLVIAIGILIIFWAENNASIDLIFEAFSAFGTVGLSAGLTPHLHDTSKIVLMLLMFFGRVGILSMVASLAINTKVSNYRYPVGRIMV